MKLKALAIGALCAIAVGFLGCSKEQGDKKDQGGNKDQGKVESATKVDQSDPLAVARAWWTAATEGDLDGLLVLTDEEFREEVKKYCEGPYTPPPWVDTNNNQGADMPKTELAYFSKYKGKPIDITGDQNNFNPPAQVVEMDGKKYAFNAPPKIVVKNGKKYARVLVVLGGLGTKEENGQDSLLVLKDGKWFVTSKRSN